MNAAIAGDSVAYRKFLESVTPFLRAIAGRRSVQLGLSKTEAEDIVQDVLLIIHLKRQTWDPSRLIGPWVAAIVRNKVIDSFRRRGHRIDVPIESVIDILEAPNDNSSLETRNVGRILAGMKELPRKIVMSISVEGASIREKAERF